MSLAAERKEQCTLAATREKDRDASSGWNVLSTTLLDVYSCVCTERGGRVKGVQKLIGRVINAVRMFHNLLGHCLSPRWDPQRISLDGIFLISLLLPVLIFW